MRKLLFLSFLSSPSAFKMALNSNSLLQELWAGHRDPHFQLEFALYVIVIAKASQLFSVK